MMARSARTTVNPALDAAGLLRRLGFFLLAVCAPVLAVVSRRGLVIVAPLGIALMVIAAIIESEGREPLASVKDFATRIGAAVAGFFVFWAALSLLWAPFPSEALDRVANILGMGALGLAATAAVPQRMRASNLYFLPVGTAVAALAALVLLLRFGPSAAAEAWFADRGLFLVALVTPASIAWLVSRDRTISAAALVALVVAALLVDRSYPTLAALLIGALVFALAKLDPARTRRACAIVVPGLVLVAPLVPFLLRPVSKLALGTNDARVETIRTWCRIVSDDPLRIVTGHGLETATRAKAAGMVPSSMPNGLLFDVWFELGILGAGSLAVLLALAILGTGRLSQAVAPGALMTIVVGYTMAALGLGLTQSWWLIGLAMAAIFILAVEHGQYRTTRPKTASLPA